MRWGTPEQIIGMLKEAEVRLIDSIIGAKFTTGEYFFVNGGEYMHQSSATF